MMKSNRASTAALVATVFFASWSSGALAWKEEGHKLVAQLASELLTPAAKEQIKKLLNPDDAPNITVAEAMKTAATKPDELRKEKKYKETAKWHFVTIPLSSDGYDRDQHCPKSDCVVEKITYYQNILKDQTRSVGERKEALTYLIHFVGDIHQPLHNADNGDTGGNEVWVSVGDGQGEPINLHRFWDENSVKAIGNAFEDKAKVLRSKIQNEYQGLKNEPVNPGAWATESFKLAKNNAYTSEILEYWKENKQDIKWAHEFNKKINRVNENLKEKKKKIDELKRLRYSDSEIHKKEEEAREYYISQVKIINRQIIAVYNKTVKKKHNLAEYIELEDSVDSLKPL